ncbi:MAG: hypothetical protein LUC86_02790 [Prevotellaceae bacterium]|nr:hypothetical protein [Prevotellaceae bacterium]
MKRICLLLVCALALASCGKKRYALPSASVDYAEEAQTYPDYNNVVVPPNIAPLNFILKEAEASEAVVEYRGSKGGQLITGAGEDLKVKIDTTEWRSLLEKNRGADLQVTVYAHLPSGWRKYKSHVISVAEEEIDPYLSYRLIEPGYELYRQLGLYQRNLTNWTVTTIYENNRVYSDEHNHCINCHNYQNNSTERMLFHVRANHGGTVIVEGTKIKKVQIKGDSILAAGVYPSWHPKSNKVAFSTNDTGQTFHIHSPEKIEVLDDKSDLLLYDVDKNEVRTILGDTMKLETFPCWSPDGNWLYYCEADEPVDESFPDSLLSQKMVRHYQDLLYDIKRLPYDQRTGKFGEAETVVDCRSRHRSASFPKLSPDGRYVLFAEGDYGQFHIWHKSSDLFVKDLRTDSVYPLTAANSPDVDSYHTWSSNSRWIVFSTRRMDGNYTRLFVAYFDRKGQAHKAFCLPQEDPEQNIMLLRSYNVPELTRDAVRVTPSELRQCIYETEGEPAKYISQYESNH